ncbi:MAG: hypothetical protein ACP5PW_06395, partial [Candidatus Dormibacteria bacterium]
FAARFDQEPGEIAVVDVDDRLRYPPELAAGERFRLMSTLGTWASLPARHLSGDLQRAIGSLRDRIGPLHARFAPRTGVWVDEIAEPIRAATLRGHDLIITTAAGSFTVSPTGLRHHHGHWMVHGIEQPTGRPIRLRLVDIADVSPAGSGSRPSGEPSKRRTWDGRPGPRITFTVDMADGWWLTEIQSPAIVATSPSGPTLTCTLEIWPEQVPWLHGLLPRLGPTLKITTIDPVLGEADLPHDIARRILTRYQQRRHETRPA